MKEITTGYAVLCVATAIACDMEERSNILQVRKEVENWSGQKLEQLVQT